MLDTFTAFGKQEQWLDPEAEALLSVGQGRHWAVLLMAGLKVEGGHGVQAAAVPEKLEEFALLHVLEGDPVKV
jgi:hypothetical protein